MGLKRSNKNHSMCEKSARIAMNIVKASSFCLARITLQPLTDQVKPSSASVKIQRQAPPPVLLSLQEESGRRWDCLKENKDYDCGPHGGSKETSATRLGGVISSNVDERASEFIDRIKRKNSFYSNMAEVVSADDLNPQPRFLPRRSSSNEFVSKYTPTN